MKADWRSLLFVSADDPVRLAKVAERDADAVILDLEDAVPQDGKARARTRLAGTIAELSQRGATLVVRINTRWLDCVADLDAAVRPGVAAIMAPGIEDALRLKVLGEMIGELEVARGLTPGGIGLIALVESAKGIARLNEIAAAPRIIGLALGSEDFALGMGVPPTPALLDLPSRLIALAASGAGIMALAVPLSIAAFRDLDARRSAIAAARAYGVTGALCIHPDQVLQANLGFSPSDAEVAEARAIIDAWTTGGSGGVISLDGRMIDLPVARRAERVLARFCRTRQAAQN